MSLVDFKEKRLLFRQLTAFISCHEGRHFLEILEVREFPENDKLGQEKNGCPTKRHKREIENNCLKNLVK